MERLSRLPGPLRVEFSATYFHSQEGKNVFKYNLLNSPPASLSPQMRKLNLGEGTWFAHHPQPEFPSSLIQALQRCPETRWVSSISSIRTGFLKETDGAQGSRGVLLEKKATPSKTLGRSECPAQTQGGLWGDTRAEGMCGQGDTEREPKPGPICREPWTSASVWTQFCSSYKNLKNDSLFLLMLPESPCLR